MASILDRYGIREVADVTFYELDSNGVPTNPVLYLDTLKVSTVEQTGETSQATGGKGNAPLIMWDYGKNITVTLEDALFSAKSMAIMFGNGSVKNYSGSTAYIMKTEQFTATGTSVPSLNPGADMSGWHYQYEGPDGKLYTKINPKFYQASGAVATTFTVGEKYFCTFDIQVNGSVIEISSNSFPGTYYVTGDTYARSEASGKDEFFQFIIPKAKVQSENTITMEAEGDPSVFNMSLQVLRPADGIMMKLVKYDIAQVGTDPAAASTSLIHNHALLNVNDPETSYTVQVGSTLALEAPEAAGDNSVTWSTTNADIATVVSGTGVVTGVAIGSVTILATWTGGYAPFDITVAAAG